MVNNFMTFYWGTHFVLVSYFQVTDGHDGQTHHISSAGLHCKMCPPGTHWVSDCTSDGQQDTCGPCPAEYYQSWYNTAQWCVPCDTECPGQDQNVHIVAACTNTSNLRCACKEGFWMKRDLKEPECRHVSFCPESFGVQKLTDDYSDTTCEPCISGSTFSNKSSKTEPCRDCTVCMSTEEVAANCTAVKDTVCRLKQPHGYNLLLNMEADKTTTLAFWERQTTLQTLSVPLAGIGLFAVLIVLFFLIQVSYQVSSILCTHSFDKGTSEFESVADKQNSTSSESHLLRS